MAKKELNYQQFMRFSTKKGKNEVFVSGGTIKLGDFQKLPYKILKNRNGHFSIIYSNLQKRPRNLTPGPFIYC
jgi:hypothetical protein